MERSKKILLSAIGMAILLILVTGATFAFFNYTRTGTRNVIKVGRIYFNSEQGDAINLSNVFPIDKSTINSDTDNVGSVTIHISGDTTYTEGIEYLVSAVDVNNTIGEGNNQKTIPIGVDVSYSANGNDSVIGTIDEEYFNNRGGNSSRYKALAGKQIAEGNKLLVGYIKPDSTGIDGIITIKAYLDKDKIAISDTYDLNSYTYSLNKNLTEQELSDCISYIGQLGTYDLYQYYSWQSHYSGPTANKEEDFCLNVPNNYNYTFESYLNSIDASYMTYFINHNIVFAKPSDNMGTTKEWVDDRVVLTTSEWNSLQTNGVSFQIKVEANEGIWVPVQGNAMNELPNGVFTTTVKNNIKEIYFNKMTKNVMHQRYEAAEIKSDITYNNEGEVLAWLEENESDNTKYTMYIASDGETFLMKGQYLFGNSSGYTKAEKIVFNNVNTSRIDDMNHMFTYLTELKELDVSSFDTSNVESMRYFINRCYNLEKVNMSGLDLQKTKDMGYMIASNPVLDDLDMSDVQMRDVTNMSSMFYGDSVLESIDLSGFGGDDLENINAMVSECFNLKYLNMHNFNFGKVTSLSSYFANSFSELEELDLSNIKISNVTSLNNMLANCSKLSNLDLSNIDASSVTNIGYMFYGCSSLTTIDLSTFTLSDNIPNNYLSNTFNGCSGLTTIYVSNAWDSLNQYNDMAVFTGCISLVGGNGTTFDSSKIYGDMAIIDTPSTPGYLTLKTS